MEAFGVDGHRLARELLQRGVAGVYLLAVTALIHQWRPLLNGNFAWPNAISRWT
jgi:hypothetical protein